MRECTINHQVDFVLALLSIEIVSVKIAVSFVQAYAEPGPVKVQLFCRAVLIVGTFLFTSCFGVCGLYMFPLTADVPQFVHSEWLMRTEILECIGECGKQAELGLSDHTSSKHSEGGDSGNQVLCWIKLQNFQFYWQLVLHDREAAVWAVSFKSYPKLMQFILCHRGPSHLVPRSWRLLSELSVRPSGPLPLQD